MTFSPTSIRRSAEAHCALASRPGGTAIDPQVLFSLAELAIGLAGFSAIVVLFKRRDSGKWLGADADRFNGMVAHSMVGAFFCFLPTILRLFSSEEESVWMVGSTILGVQIFIHAGIILSVPSTRRMSGVPVVAGAGAVIALQIANAAQWGFAREFLPYLVGVLWHVLQAGGLFLMLIWVRDTDVEGR
jgi:membrane-bound metal-dependent hydrolase YbcI (DUF457 family)